MPIREFLCGDCGHQFEEILRGYDPDTREVSCPHCDSSKTEKLFSIIGGYHMNSGPSSVRPKSAGSRPRKSK